MSSPQKRNKRRSRGEGGAAVSESVTHHPSNELSDKITLGIRYLFRGSPGWNGLQRDLTPDEPGIEYEAESGKPQIYSNTIIISLMYSAIIIASQRLRR